MWKALKGTSATDLHIEYWVHVGPSQTPAATAARAPTAEFETSGAIIHGLTRPLDRLLFRCRCRCCCFWVRRTWQREMSEARQWAETLAYQKAAGKAASLSSFVFVSLALTSSKPPPAAADWPLRKRRFHWASTLSSVHVSWFPTPPGRASGAL